MTDQERIHDLPWHPSRDNDGRSCDLVEDSDLDLPAHVVECTCDPHHGVCVICNFKITVGPSGLEYGHGRADNRGADDDGVRRDCPHRPPECNPGDEQVWEGHGDDSPDTTTGATSDD